MATLRSLVMRGRTFRPMPTAICVKLAVVPPLVPLLVWPDWNGTSEPSKNLASLLSLVNTRGCCRMRTFVFSSRACSTTVAGTANARMLLLRSPAKSFCRSPANIALLVPTPLITMALLGLLGCT